MDDKVVKFFAGHMGVAAVLANVLIDKGIVRREELVARFKQAQKAARTSSANPQAMQMLRAMVSYLESERRDFSNTTEH